MSITYLCSHYKEIIKIFENKIFRKMFSYNYGYLHILKEKDNDIKVKIKKLCEEKEFKFLEDRIIIVVTVGKTEFKIIFNNPNKKLKFCLKNNPQKLKILSKRNRVGTI